MMRSSQMAGVIGEPIVTVRAGRYVIPIRAEAKGRVKGIVHDQSASGRDALRRAADGRRAEQHLDGGHPGGSAGGGAHPRRAVGAWSRREPRRCARAWPRWPGPTCGWRARGWARRWTASARPWRPMPSSCCPRAIRCSVRRPCRSTCASAIGSATARSWSPVRTPAARRSRSRRSASWRSCTRPGCACRPRAARGCRSSGG